MTTDHPPAVHRAYVESDRPVTVTISDEQPPPQERWFKLFAALVEDGHWAELSNGACRVLVALAKHTDDQWQCHPGIATLCRLAGVGRATAYRAIDELERKRLIERLTTGGGKPGRTTRYEVTAPVTTGRTRETRLTGETPDASRQRDATGPARETQTTPVERDQKNNGNAAVALLSGQGFRPGDAARLAEITDVEQIEIAIRNADHLAGEGKLRNRRGYIRKAIEDEYSLLDEVEAAEKQADLRAERAAREAEGRQRAQAEAADLERERAAVQAHVDALSDEELAERAAEAIETLPARMRQRYRSADARANGTIKRAVYALAQETDA